MEQAAIALVGDVGGSPHLSPVTKYRLSIKAMAFYFLLNFFNVPAD